MRRAPRGNAREAPFIGGLPRLDGTDAYANYIPFQDPQGGPNFYPLDTNAYYDIDVFTTGDAVTRYTFEFKFNNVKKNLAMPTFCSKARCAALLENVGPRPPILTRALPTQTARARPVLMQRI